MRVNDHRLATLAYALLIDGLILSKGIALAVTQIPQGRYSNAIDRSKNEKIRQTLVKPDFFKSIDQISRCHFVLTKVKYGGGAAPQLGAVIPSSSGPRKSATFQPLECKVLPYAIPSTLPPVNS